MWPDKHLTVCEDLTAEHFASAANRRIYFALVCMHRAEEPTDLVTVRDRLLHGGDLKDVGWPEYLIDLVEQTERAFQGAVGTDYLHGPAEMRSDGLRQAGAWPSSPIVKKVFRSLEYAYNQSAEQDWVRSLFPSAA